jgi:hypothetical protein
MQADGKGGRMPLKPLICRVSSAVEQRFCNRKTRPTSHFVLLLRNLHQQGLDTATPGKAMFQMLRVFAEFERTIIP